LIANSLTLVRLFLTPLIFYYLISNQPIVSAITFAVAGLTDLFDGLVARSIGQVTWAGKLLDPLVDRLLIITVIIGLYLRSGFPPLWIILLLGLREASLAIGYAWLAVNKLRMEVTYLGKLSTAIIIISLFLIIVRLTLGGWLFYFGVVLYLGAGFNYYQQGKKQLTGVLEARSP
jgi:cardiolipin synthase